MIRCSGQFTRHTRGEKRFYWGESRDLSEKDIFSANKNWQCRTDSNRAGKSREVIKQQGNTVTV